MISGYYFSKESMKSSHMDSFLKAIINVFCDLLVFENLLNLKVTLQFEQAS